MLLPVVKRNLKLCISSKKRYSIRIQKCIIMTLNIYENFCSLYYWIEKSHTDFQVNIYSDCSIETILEFLRIEFSSPKTEFIIYE